jgi:Tfp pilus assembly protein PilF
MSAAQTAVAATEEPPGAQYMRQVISIERDKLILALAAMQEGDTQQAHRLVEQALIDGGRG